MGKKKTGSPPKAKDLLPPDGPTPVDPKTVMPASDPLEPEVEDRKIGIRRVSSLAFGNKLFSRANRRSAGNSRSFWRNIEADDPFLRAPARPTDMPIEIYPAQRIERTSGSRPKPQPDVARAYPPPVRSEEPQGNRPKPMREKARPKKPAPEARHTPEPRPAKPPPPRPTPQPVPEPVAAPVSPQPEGRRLPPKPPSSNKGGGRIRTGGGRKRMPSAGPPPPQRRSAAEIRAEKQRQRDEAMDKDKPVKSSHNLDAYRDFVQMMEIQEAAYNAGEDVPTAFADQADEPVRKPKPAPKPTPPVDRSPPKPKAAAKPPVNRSPGGGNSGGMDDLFGGPQEGRVRIGKRAKPTGPTEES